MNVDKLDNNTTFGQRVKFNTLTKSAEKLAKDLGTTPEMIAGAASVGSLSSSASVLAAANYSGLEKILPINVSLPLGTGIASTAGYESFVGHARKVAEQEAKNAKRRGAEVVENQTDPDFVKAIYRNLKERLKNIWKINNNKGNI